MKVYCEGLDLSSAVLTVIKASSTKGINPILEGVKLSAKADCLTLTCTDQELAIEKKIRADVKVEGETVVPGKLFSEFIKMLDREQIELTLNDNNSLKIKYTDSETYIQCQNANEFPTIQKIDNAQFFSIKQNELKDLIEKTIFSVAQDDTRPILKGCLMQIEKNLITCVALDGYRMAIATKTLTEVSANFGVVVPSRSLVELSKLLEENADEIRVFVQKNFLMIQSGDTKITTRLLGTDKEYVNYKQIIPSNFSSQLVINKAQLESGLERASILARQNNDNSVKFSIKENVLTLSAKAEIGNVTENVTISLQGNDLNISFNSYFFRECLRSVKDEYIKLKFNASINPCVIVPSDENNSYLFIILPVKSIY